MSKKHSKSAKSRSDAAVQGTNDNSIVSKHSMASLGYFEDEFLQYVVAKKLRRAPLINRGYYIRAKVINHMLSKFLHQPATGGEKKQILSLGAGFDTAYFRLKSEGLLENCVFVEIDFPDVVRRKAESIDNQEKLRDLLEDCETSPISPQIVINSPDYKLLGVDLTDLQTLQACMKACDVDTTQPTALLSECVITYMSTKNSSKLIQWCSDYFDNAVFITYEQIKPDDAFGHIMCAHFKKIGSPLRGINLYPTIIAQEKRYLSLGWEQCCTSDMNTFYNSLPWEEKERVNGIEPFDEFEEWHLKCAHYIVLTAEKGDCKGIYTTADSNATSQSVKSPGRNLSIRIPSDGLCLQRIGHTCTVVDGVAMVTGGFGSSDGKHRRQREVAAVDIRSGRQVEVVTDSTSELIDERLFHSATLIKKDTVLILGGRTSPTRARETGLLLKVTFQTSPPDNTTTPADRMESAKSENDLEKNSQLPRTAGAVKSSNLDNELNSEFVMDNCNVEHCDLMESSSGRCAPVDINGPSKLCSADFPGVGSRTVRLKCENLHVTGDVPSPRWRHTATRVEIDGQEKVILFGGRSTSNLVLGDAFILDVETLRWRKLDVEGSPPSPRHSHSAATWNNSLVISGGLGLDLQPLNSVHILNVDTMTWSEMDCRNTLIPRYSHTSHVAGNKLWLVGGIAPSTHPPIALTSIDLLNGLVEDYAMPTPSPDTNVPCLMLHNHWSTPVTTDGGLIMILGGGGNCFSFGTHLNKTPVLLDLSHES